MMSTWEKRDGDVREVGRRPPLLLRVGRREHVEDGARRDGGERVHVAAAAREQHHRLARRGQHLVCGHDPGQTTCVAQRDSLA
jgi:hypothetical protein